MRTSITAVLGAAMFLVQFRQIIRYGGSATQAGDLIAGGP